MASWAEKKRKRDESKKLGRPPKEGVREPNGRISRTGIKHEEANKVAIRARIRRLGITEDQAMDQKAGSFIGYLALLGPTDGLSEAQYEGAVAYLTFRDRLQRSILSPGAIYDPEATGGSNDDPDAYTKWAAGLKTEWDDLKKSIQSEQNHSRENLWAALQYVVIDGLHLHHMVGATRLLCNVLARHFKTTRENRRAA